MSLSTRLAGKVAIVTGAAGGIGTATAIRLSNEGAFVILAGRRRETLEAVATQIKERGGRCLVEPVDIVDPSSVDALLAFTASRAGGVDFIFNNAATTDVTEDGSVANTDIELWDRTFAVNLRGTMLMCRAAIPLMRLRGGGSIVNVASGVGILADVARSAYGVSKAAVIALTRFVATQEGKNSIRCNAISPGLIVTPTVEQQLPAQVLSMMLRHTLAPNLGRPEDIAAVAAFLAADEAAFITGQLLGVDGGALIHLPYYADLMEQG